MAHATNPSSAELLEQLVAFDTTSNLPTLPLIAHVAQYLQAHGVRHRIVADPDGRHADLHAVIGPDSAGGIALSGHVDTVPVAGQAWSGDPFVLRRCGERLVGRGAADMKGFVACCLAAVPHFMAADLARPVHLCITYDEEVNCTGVRRLLADMGCSGWLPELCIVGEPSGMRPIVAHKGKLSVRVRVRGRAGHASVPARGVNAVVAASRAVAWLAEEDARLAADGPFADGFDPPCTTAQVGVLSGGTSINIIPEHAEFLLEIRDIPGCDAHGVLARLRQYVARALEPAMQATHPASGFAFEVLSELPRLSLAADHPLVRLVAGLTGANGTGRVSYGTEGGFYQNAGIATIVCGPGDIAQAHQPDEWIAAGQLAACDAFLRALPSRLAA
jgi:acetylornithine deacetylase